MLRPLSLIDDVLGRQANDLHDTRELIALILAWKHRVAHDQLADYAAQAPHVNGHAVLGAQDDLGRSVVSRLNVGINALVLVATGAKVNDLDAAAARLLQEYILGLEIAVNDLISVQKLQTLQNMIDKLLDERQREAGELVLAYELVQVHGQEFERDADVTAEGERVDHVYDVVGVVVVLALEVLQDAYLLVRLPQDLLLVAHELQGHVLAELVVVALEHLAEGALAERAQDLVAIGDVVVNDGPVGALLVVVAAVERARHRAAYLLGVLAHEVDLVVAENLGLLVRC